MLGISGVLEYMTDNLRSLLEKIDFEVANKICDKNPTKPTAYSRNQKHILFFG